MNAIIGNLYPNPNSGIKYSGLETNTASVTVNNTSYTISVDVLQLSPRILDVPSPTATGTYVLQQQNSDTGSVLYSWVNYNNLAP